MWYLFPYRLVNRPHPSRRPVRVPAADEAGIGDVWREAEILGGWAVVAANRATPDQLDALDAVRDAIALPRSLRLTGRLADHLNAAGRLNLRNLASTLGYANSEIDGVNWATTSWLGVLVNLLGKRRRKPRWDDAAQQIMLDGPEQPVTPVWQIAGGAFGDQAILDNFNRADGGLGSNWTMGYYGGDTLSIASNQAYSGGGYRENRWNPATYGTPENYITIATLPASGEQVYLDVRIANPGATTLDCYEVVYTNAATDTAQIYRVDNGTATQLGSTINQNFSAGDGLGLSATGSTIEAWRRSSGTWSLLGSRTDSTYSAAGYLGIGSGGTTARLDDFGGGTYVAGGGTTYTETATATLTMIASGADVRTAPETVQSVIGGFVASGADVRTVSETSQSTIGGFVASGADTWAMSDTATPTLSWVPSAADVFAQSDSVTPVLSWAPTAADVFAQSDTVNAILQWLAEAADTFSPGGGTTYTETVTAVLEWLASGADVAAISETTLAELGYIASGADSATLIETASAVLTLTASATDTAAMSDGGTALVELLPLAADQFSMTDAALAVLNMTVSVDTGATEGLSRIVRRVLQGEYNPTQPTHRVGQSTRKVSG